MEEEGKEGRAEERIGGRLGGREGRGKEGVRSAMVVCVHERPYRQGHTTRSGVHCSLKTGSHYALRCALFLIDRVTLRAQ
eukprot:1701116-Rhodomonas_salina.1